MNITFKDTRRTLKLLSLLKSPPLNNLSLEERGELEDLLKKMCVLRFIAEFEYYMIEIISNRNLNKGIKKNVRNCIIGKLKYENIKKLFKENFWKNIERETLQNIRSKKKEYKYFVPSSDAPFDNFVKIRNELAHSLDTEELIDINTLIKTVDYMEELLNTLNKYI